jgi:hypothetical protein
MKRLAVALALVAALVAPASATAVQPAKYPTPFSDLDLAAGIVCPFEVFWHGDPNNGFEIDHFNNDGSFAWAWGGGNNVTHVTNLSNGHTVALNTTGPGRITVNDDGSLTIDGTGHWLIGYGPADSPPSSLLYYSGHIVLNVSPTGQITLISYIGEPAQDVCAMIA